MSKAKRSALWAIVIVVGVMAFAMIACDSTGDVRKDLPRFGDSMRIGEALEKATCESSGGRWSDAIKQCKK